MAMVPDAFEYFDTSGFPLLVYLADVVFENHKWCPSFMVAFFISKSIFKVLNISKLLGEDNVELYLCVKS
jgi:hypothetical protein